MWRETNWGLNGCSGLILTCPRHRDRTCPSAQRTEVRREVCLGEANHDFKQSIGTRALVPAPFNGTLWLGRIFGWVGWMAFVTSKGKLRVFSMQMTWFYCHQPGMASLLSEEMAQDELLQPPVVIFGRCSPTWSWLLFNNVRLALLFAGHHFPTQSPGGLARRCYLPNSRCLWVQY